MMRPIMSTSPIAIELVQNKSEMPTRRSGWRPPLRLAAAVCLLSCTWNGETALPALGDELDWDRRPYRIQLIVAFDLPGGLSEQLSEAVPEHLRRRTAAAMGSLWSLDVQLAARSRRYEVLTQSEATETPPSPALPADADKLVLVGVRYQPEGFVLSAREFDRYVERWSLPIRRMCRQEQGLLEQLFVLLSQVVAPLARFELVPDHEEQVLLLPRGAALAHANNDEPGCERGAVFLPILRRTTRSGELISGGIQAVPWTFIEVVDCENNKATGHIWSANRRPFGDRRLGRVEQVAIAIRSDPGHTVVRLVSRGAPEKPLVGYELYAQSSDVQEQAAVVRLGESDAEGKVRVPPTSDRRVRMLYLKNGGLVLARLPIVPGAERQVDVPLADDDPRLAAETRLAAIREELVDVVARRNILMARARQKIKTADFAAAQQLLEAINQLPGRSQFNLTLMTIARLTKSDDPQIQRRIEQLFEATQSALSQYLDPRPVSELQNELREAQRKGV